MKPNLGRDCRQTQLLLDEFARGELEAKQHAVVEKHLATCEHCQNEYAALSVSQQALAQFPQIQASPDFELKVLDQLMLQESGVLGFFDRLDAFFARPLNKLMGSVALSLLLGLTTLVIALGPSTLLAELSSPPAARIVASPAVTMAKDPDEVLERYYASGRLSPDLWSDSDPLTPRPTRPTINPGGVPAWKPSRKSSPTASDYSYSALSGSSC